MGDFAIGFRDLERQPANRAQLTAVGPTIVAAAPMMRGAVLERACRRRPAEVVALGLSYAAQLLADELQPLRDQISH